MRSRSIDRCRSLISEVGKGFICVSKTTFLTRFLQNEGFHPAGQRCGNDFAALPLRKISPARPAKPGDTNENEGLAALHCILHICSLLFQQSEGGARLRPPPKYIRKSYGIFCSRFYERSPRVRVVLCLTKRKRRHAVRKLLCNPYCSLRVRHAEFQAFAPPAPHSLLGLRNGMRCRSGRCPLLLYACLPRDYSIVIRFSSNLT